MNLQQLDEKFSISEQIALDDIKILASQGVKTIICNRPDDEEPNQITCAEIKAVADEFEINFVHIPVPSRDIPADALQEFSKVIASTNEKTHAYCKTGTRSSIFWELSRQNS